MHLVSYIFIDYHNGRIKGLSRDGPLILVRPTSLAPLSGSCFPVPNFPVPAFRLPTFRPDYQHPSPCITRPDHTLLRTGFIPDTPFRGEKPVSQQEKAEKVQWRSSDTPFRAGNHVSRTEKHPETCTRAATHLFRTRSLCRDGKKLRKCRSGAATHLFGEKNLCRSRKKREKHSGGAAAHSNIAIRMYQKRHKKKLCIFQIFLTCLISPHFCFSLKEIPRQTLPSEKKHEKDLSFLLVRRQ